MSSPANDSHESWQRGEHRHVEAVDVSFASANRVLLVGRLITARTGPKISSPPIDGSVVDVSEDGRLDE